MTKPLSKFIQIVSTNNNLNALDTDGNVWVYTTKSGERRCWIRLHTRRVIPASAKPPVRRYRDDEDEDDDY